MKPKETIPIHQIQTHLKDSFFIKQYDGLDESAHIWMNVRHRDEYFIFLLLKNGILKMDIDFRNVSMTGPSIFYVKPGQVHNVHFLEEGLGWTLAVEPGFLHRSHRQALENPFIDPVPIQSKELMRTFILLEKLMQTLTASDATHSSQLRKDMVNSMVGLITECVPHETDITLNGNIPERSHQIYNSFRALASQHFRTIKKPSAYAEKLHISLSYLNEVVKSISGFTVSYWIHYEVVLEAKRLLFYSSLTIKEISYTLGYEDPAYLSRLFSRNAGTSPQSFRNKNRE
ncbi:MULTISPECIES: AraC family transcriptional regulator [Chitinophagaceae]